MLLNFSPWKWLRAKKSARKTQNKPLFKRFHPEFEQLEIRWLPSAVTLGLLNDTSIGAKVTSDGRLTGTISDPGYSVNGKTVTFTGGVTGSTTTDTNGNYTFTPTLSSQGAYNSIVASFTDHTNTTINSPAYSFTYDTVAPSVTLTAPANSDSATISVTVSATDTNLPDGSIVRLDVDKNNDGNFTDSGEQNYTSAILVSGTVTFSSYPGLPAGTVKLRARVFEQANNVGTSSTSTTVINAWATSGQQRTTDPAQTLTLPFGQAIIAPNTGSFRIFHQLDFDLSPGTSVGRDPAFVYSSETVFPQPIVEATLDSDPAGSVPTNIQVTLTWNGGTPQTAVNFSTTGHSAGDVYLLATQVSSAVASTGAYSWSMAIHVTFSGSPAVDRTVSGTAYVVVSPSNNPYMVGWNIAGVDQLVSVTGGQLWVAGAGGFRFFTGSGGTYTSPANDFGVLVKNGDNTFTYTAKDQTLYKFNTSGQLVNVTDTHGLTTTYTYTSTRLTNVSTPDGGLTTLSYTTDFSGNYLISSIAEPGSRSPTFARHMTAYLTGITDPDNSLRTFTYDGNNRLMNDQWSPLNATYTYDGTTGLLSSVDRGLGTTLNLAPASSQGLATSPAKNASAAVAVVTDALSQLTTYTLDSQGRLTQLKTPDGASNAYVLDQAGQPITYTDPISRVTTMMYQYGSGKGDEKQITFPDGSTNQFQYHGTFHKPTQIADTLNHLTTLTSDGSTGDLLTVRNALNQVTSMTYSTGLLQTVTDPLGRTRTFTYDSNRRLSTTTDALNDVATLTYDSSGNPQTTKDALGRVTTTVYDAKNRLINVTNAASGLGTIAYDTANDLTSMINPLGTKYQPTYDQRGWKTSDTTGFPNPYARTNTFTYDALGRLTAATDSNNHTTTMTYDAVGRMLTRKSPVGAVETFTYDLAGQLTSYADGLNHTTTFQYNQRGWQTQQQDPLGYLTTAMYDTERNLTASIDALGNRTTMTFDALNRVVQVKDALGDLSTISYDAAGNRIAVTDARGNTATVAYDALNRPVAQTDALGHTVTAVYDGVGNVIRSQDALAYTTTMAYDNLNRRTSVQDPGGGIWTTVYDAMSNVVNTVDPLNNKSTFSYDALNRVTTATDPRGGVTTMTYDRVNNVTSITDSVNNTTTFVYDSANRLTQQTDALSHSSTYAYDLANRLTSTTDRDGRRIDLTYDNDNRKTGENWVVSGSTVNALTFTYDANRNLRTAANNAGAYTMSYDTLNRVTQTQEPFGLTLTASYDGVGNRTKLQDSFGGVLTSIYDAANRLTSRQFGGASQTPLRLDLTYTARNQVATETRYSDLGAQNKIGSSTFTYDPAARLSNLQHFNGSGSSLANYTYTYDLASRLTTEVLNGTTTTYQYDTANELTNDTAHAYSYDLNGNRNYGSYTTGSGNQLTNDGVWTYTYDAEGNLTKKSKGPSAETWTYGYDNKNHMAWAKDSSTDGGTVTTLATYVYDALGNRIEKDVWTQASGTTTTTRFGYDGIEVWVDLTSGNALQTRYIYGDLVDQLFARIGSSGTAAWYLTDRLGSVRDIVNASGTVIDHIDYDGFGNATETQPTNGDRYKWTGREFDSETGLQYNRARYYDPKAGRWLENDPLGFRAGDQNLYRYGGNAPTIHSDPSGLDWPEWIVNHMGGVGFWQRGGGFDQVTNGIAGFSAPITNTGGFGGAVEGALNGGGTAMIVSAFGTGFNPAAAPFVLVAGIIGAAGGAYSGYNTGKGQPDFFSGAAAAKNSGYTWGPIVGTGFALAFRIMVLEVAAAGGGGGDGDIDPPADSTPEPVLKPGVPGDPQTATPLLPGGSATNTDLGFGGVTVTDNFGHEHFFINPKDWGPLQDAGVIPPDLEYPPAWLEATMPGKPWPLNPDLP